MRHRILAAVFSIAILGSVPFNYALADGGWAAWDEVSPAEMASLRGGSLPEGTKLNSDNGADGITEDLSVAGGNAALQIVSNQIDGAVGDTGSINNLNVGGKMNVNAINTGNNNTMLNQLTVIVEMPN
jgi:hypothetical protein